MANSRLQNAISYLKGLFVSPEAPTGALWELGMVRQPPDPITSINPTPPSFPTKGKITSYNYKGESKNYQDSLTKQNLGAFGDNQLTKDSLAVSPDIEEQFRKAGIKPRQPVELMLADGSTVIRYWDDRTMGDKQATKTFGKPLRGRYDFNMDRADSKHSKDDMAVVGFRIPETPPKLALTSSIPSPINTNLYPTRSGSAIKRSNPALNPPPFPFSGIAGAE